MGKHWLIVLACAVGLAVPRIANAQISVWMQNGVSGVGAEAGVEVDNNSTTYHVSGGYSHLGALDIDLSFTYSTFNMNNAIASDLAAYGTALTLQYHPLKQGPDMPISLGLQVGGLYSKLTSAQLDTEGVSGTITGIAAGVAAYRFFKLAPKFGVTPSVGIAYTYAHLALDDMAGNALTNNNNDFGVDLTANFGFLASNGIIYGISPELIVSDNVQFILNVSLIGTLGH